MADPVLAPVAVAITRDEVLRTISRLNPRRYGETRNYLDGDVARIGAGITHGSITLREVATAVIEANGVEASLPFLFQLTWREHFYRLWIRRGEEIFSDLIRPQPRRARDGIPEALLQGRTGVEVVDHAVRNLLEHGYLHNHERLWLAAVATNNARCDWRAGARWMFSHLVDGDVASNWLSWQWVAGTGSSKCYFANQENLNRFSRTEQRNTFLDCSYEELLTAPIPSKLQEVVPTVQLPSWNPLHREVECSVEPVMLYLPWTLDPLWRRSESGKRVVWFDSSFFARFPVTAHRGAILERLISEIPGATWFVGTTDELHQACIDRKVVAREHPLLPAWVSARDDSAMLFPHIHHSGGSCMGFWKRCEAHLRKVGRVTP